ALPSMAKQSNRSRRLWRAMKGVNRGSEERQTGAVPAQRRAAVVLIVFVVAALLEMGEDVGDELGVLDAGEDLEVAAAAQAGIDVDGEHAFEAPHPVIETCLGARGSVLADCVGPPRPRRAGVMAVRRRLARDSCESPRQAALSQRLVRGERPSRLFHRSSEQLRRVPCGHFIELGRSSQPTETRACGGTTANSLSREFRKQSQSPERLELSSPVICSTSTSSAFFNSANRRGPRISAHWRSASSACALMTFWSPQPLSVNRTRRARRFVGSG